MVLERDGWRCMACGKAGRLEVDHVIPVFRGGAEMAPENCQTLCRGCHISKTRREAGKTPTPERLAWQRLLEAEKVIKR